MTTKRVLTRRRYRTFAEERWLKRCVASYHRLRTNGAHHKRVPKRQPQQTTKVDIARVARHFVRL